MNKQAADLIKRIVLSFAVGVLSLLMVYFVLYATGEEFITDDRYLLDDGWNAITDIEEYENVTLSTQQFPIFEKGDTLVLKRTLPEDCKVRNPVLRFYTVHSTASVYIGDVCIYEYGISDAEHNLMLGYGPHYVSLPVDYAGQELTIEMYVTENNAFGGVQTMYIADGATMIQRILSDGREGLTISLFLIAFGVLGMLLSAISITQNITSFRIFCLTTFSFCAGVWTLCNSDMVMCFSTDLHVKVYLEYMFFFFILIPYLGYFYDVTKEKYPKPLKIYYWIMQVGTIVFFVTIMVLHIMNVVHFPAFVSAEHVLFVLTLIFVVLYYVFKIIRTRKIDWTLMIGVGLASVFMLVELFRFNIDKYFKGFSDNSFDSYLEVATLIIVIAMFVDFASRLSRSVKEDAYANALKEMAYLDELTGLANRRKCDEYMQEIQKNKVGFCIVSLDMNNLKKINDTYGHSEGDVALKAFSEILSKSFKKANVVGRMGGDEYIVIWANTTEEDVEHALDKLSDYMIDYNALEQKPYRLSVAYGYEFGDENADPQKVYVIADDSMYEHKRVTKMNEAKAKEKNEGEES